MMHRLLRCGACGGRFFPAEMLLGSMGKSLEIVQCGDCGVLANWTGMIAEDVDGSESVAQDEGLEDVYGWPNDSDCQRAQLDTYSKFLHGALTSFSLPRSGTFLDVGCGRGLVAYAACALYDSVLATDLRPDLLEAVCHDMGRPANLTIQKGLLPAEGSYDVIWMWHVLEHLMTPREALSRARSILSAGGRIVLQVPLFRPDYVFPQHLYFYNQHTVSGLSMRCGLIPLDVSFDLERSFMSVVLERPE